MSFKLQQEKITAASFIYAKKEFSSKNEMYSWISRSGYGMTYSGRHGVSISGYMNTSRHKEEEYLLMFTAQKRHKKVKRLTKTFKGKAGRVQKSEIISPNMWKVTFFKFPTSLVQYAKQHDRHHDVVINIKAK